MKPISISAVEPGVERHHEGSEPDQPNLNQEPERLSQPVRAELVGPEKAIARNAFDAALIPAQR